MKKLLLLFVLTTLLVTGCSIQNNSKNTDFGGIIEARDGIIYDFGDIDINSGTVSRSFNFTNNDTKPLAIYEATTSCGCTTGTVTVQGQAFGPFGMHNQTQEIIEVPAGGFFTVTINYDPLFHGPTDLGKRQRTLFLFSSASADGEIVREYKGKPNFTEISVVGNVVSNE